MAETMPLWCQERHVTLRARHIPGKLNVRADLLSREHKIIHYREWMLNRDVFQGISWLWGNPKYTFATMLNKQVQIYISPIPDEQAHGVDTVSMK